MNVIFITIFPELIQTFCAASLLGKAQTNQLVTITTVNPRDFAAAPHYRVDDIPYGGGAGMVMLAEPLLAAIRHSRNRLPEAKVILMSPSGILFSQAKARQHSSDDLIIVCGRYEGIDQRVIDAEIDEEYSIGDFILMGGELAGLCILEACARLIPGVLGNSDSASEESFDQSGLLEGPCYSRPASLPEGEVPQVLTSGNHEKIHTWRMQQRKERTQIRRPDLLKKG